LIVGPSTIIPNPLFFQNPDPPQSGQWPSSPFLPQTPGEQPFIVEIGQIDNMTIDYAVVTATNTTDLGGKTILVDDDNSEIIWSGNWERQINHEFWMIGLQHVPEEGRTDDVKFHFSQRSILAMPHGNGTHKSNITDDSFMFKFAGE